MKLMKYSWLAALPMLFTACQDDEVVVENQQTDKLIYTLSANVGGESADSRAQIQLNNPLSGEEFFFWNEKDSFNLYQNVYNDEYNQVLSVFNISDDYTEPTQGAGLSATFHTKNPAFADMDYYAFYPGTIKLKANSVSLKFELPTSLDFRYVDVEEGWNTYFQNYMYMMAKGKFSDVENASVSFKHLCSLARITYINKTDSKKTLSQYGIQSTSGASGEFQKFGHDYRYYVHEDYGNVIGQGASVNMQTQGLSVEVGDTIDLYALFYPLAFAPDDTPIKLTMTDYYSRYTYLDLTVADFKAANPGDTAFVAGKRYWFKVTDTEDGLVWTKDYNKVNGISNVVIPSKTFSKALYEYLEHPDRMPGAVTFDADSCAVMKQSDADLVTKLVFNNYRGDNYEIYSLRGIENFSNLDTLECVYTGLAGALDLSQNTALKKVDVSANPGLTSLDVSTLENLIDLRYSEAAISSFEIPKAAVAKIQILHCGRLIDGPANYVPTNINSFISLTDLACYGQAFTLTDEGIKAQLTDLQCYDCGISTLDLTEYPKLRSLACYRNNLTQLVIPEGSVIGNLTCYGNKLTALDVTPLENSLYYLECGIQNIEGNMVLSMTTTQSEKWYDQTIGWLVKANGSNDRVFVNDSTLDTMVVISSTSLSLALKEYYDAKLDTNRVVLNETSHALMDKEFVEQVEVLDFENIKTTIATLNGIENFKSLRKLLCKNTALETIDLSYNTKLDTLHLTNDTALEMLTLNMENLKSLRISGFTALNYLDVSRCYGLTDFALANCARLEILQSSSTSAKVIEGVSSEIKAQLMELRCNYGSPAVLDLKEYPKLEILHCENNGLTSLELSNCPNLIEVMCDGNELTSLDASGLNALRMLFANKNQLTSLKVTDCANLKDVQCHTNKMTALDLSGCASLKMVLCGLQDNANNGKMYVKLHDSMKNMWNNAWSTDDYNEGVECVDTLPDGGDTGEEEEVLPPAATGGAGAGNFTNQGVF